MGEQFKRDHAHRFKHMAELAHQREFQTGNLFSRLPDCLEQSFNCESDRPVPDLLCAEVVAYVESDGVRIVHGGEAIGHVLDGEATKLSDAIRSTPLCPGFAVAVVDEASAITGDFIIRLITDRSRE